jgi:hypothetical protein
MLLTPRDFDQLIGAIKLGQRLFDKAEMNLLRGASAEWTPQELEQWVGYSEPEPTEPQYGRLTQMFRTALCGPQSPKGEPSE